MAENEKLANAMSEDELEEVAGGSTFENNQLFKALNEKNPSFAASIEQCYQAALAQGHSQDTARGFANQQMRNVLCALVPQLDASQTFLHRNNAHNTYRTTDGRELTHNDVLQLINNDF